MAGESVPAVTTGVGVGAAAGLPGGKGDGVLRLRGGSDGGEDDADRVGARSGALAFGLAFGLALLAAAFFVGLGPEFCFLGGGAASLSARLLRLEARVSRVGADIFFKYQVACYVTLKAIECWQWEGSTSVRCAGWL
jgi:hypothetical protein